MAELLPDDSSRREGEDVVVIISRKLRAMNRHECFGQEPFGRTKGPVLLWYTTVFNIGFTHRSSVIRGKSAVESGHFRDVGWRGDWERFDFPPVGVKFIPYWRRGRWGGQELVGIPLIMGPPKKVPPWRRQPPITRDTVPAFFPGEILFVSRPTISL